MNNICIQIQPERAPELSIKDILLAAQRIAADKSLVNGLNVSTGNDNGPYTNLLFNAVDRKSLWKRLKHELYEGEWAEGLTQSSIVTCEGQCGWDDYLLLFHFDPNVKRDEIEDFL